MRPVPANTRKGARSMVVRVAKQLPARGWIISEFCSCSISSLRLPNHFSTTVLNGLTFELDFSQSQCHPLSKPTKKHAYATGLPKTTAIRRSGSGLVRNPSRLHCTVLQAVDDGPARRVKRRRSSGEAAKTSRLRLIHNTSVFKDASLIVPVQALTKAHKQVQGPKHLTDCMPKVVDQSIRGLAFCHALVYDLRWIESERVKGKSWRLVASAPADPPNDRLATECSSGNQGFPVQTNDLGSSCRLVSLFVPLPRASSGELQ